MIANGTLGPLDFTSEGLREAAVTRLTARMTYRLGDRVRGGTVHVTMAGGQVRSQSITAALGSSGRPLSAGRLAAKFAGCCRAAGIEQQRIEAALALVGSLEACSDVSELAALRQGDAVR
jgi:hypothetical protein